jgi:hypothetical protein
MAGGENDMKSSISMKSWKTTISMSALVFLMFAPTVLIWPFTGVSMPSSLSSPVSLANGSITYDEGANVITATGYSSDTPCTFNDVWKADKAGTQELVHARAITGEDGAPVSVSHALRPTDQYVLGLADVHMTITHFTANSTIQIVGTEEYGAAQTENIAVTANDKFNSTKYWRTITSTQVTVFGGNFTYTLIQGQWGVVWRQGTYQYQIDASLYIGDGSTSTYFTDVEKQVAFTASGGAGTKFLWIRTAATYTLGQLDNLANRITSRGCHVIYTPNVNANFINGDGVGYFYSCQFTFINGLNRIANFGLTSRIWNCNLNKRATIYAYAGDIYNLVATSMGSGDFALRETTGTINRIFISNYYRLIDYGGVSGVYNLKGVTGTLAAYKTIGILSGCTATINLINCDFDVWSFYWNLAPLATVNRQYTFDLRVTDKNNNPLSGATVTLKDKNGTTVFSVTTDVSGDITTQTVSRGYYNQANGETLQEYSPHSLAIKKTGYHTYTGNFALSQKANWTIALQQVADGGLIEHVGFVPVDPGLTSPSGTYRWLDVADQAYGIGYDNSYNYSQADVEVAYCTEGNKLQGLLKASNLKPNFAYQLKLVGTPGTADNERIGLAGRWWQEEWTGTTWANGQNLNDKGDGSSPNPNDQTYLSRRYLQDSSSPTGYHYRYTGYLVFNYFITDSNGTTTLQFETGSCYHVIWKTTQRSNAPNDGLVETVTFDPAPSQPAYDTDYPSNTVSIFGEWERLPMGQVNLQSGEYNCQIILTEESFHGSGGTLAGNWAGAVTTNIMFTIN